MIGRLARTYFTRTAIRKHAMYPQLLPAWYESVRYISQDSRNLVPLDSSKQAKPTSFISLLDRTIKAKESKNWEKEDYKRLIKHLRASEFANDAFPVIFAFSCIRYAQINQSTSQEVLRYLSMLVSLLNNYNKKLDIREVIECAYSLRGIRSTNKELLHFLSYATKRVKEIPDNELTLFPRYVSNLMLSLQYLDIDDGAEVTEWLHEVNRIMKSNPNVILNHQGVASAVYGLRRLGSKTDISRQLIATITDVIRISEVTLNSQDVGMAGYGLRNMSSSFSEVLSLIQVLTALVRKSDSIDPQAFAMAVRGMHGLDSNLKEVREYISVITDKFPTSITNASRIVYVLTTILTGLENLNSDTIEVRRLLKALIPLIDVNVGEISPVHLGFGMRGLKNMSSDCDEVIAILGMLIEVVKSCQSPFQTPMQLGI